MLKNLHGTGGNQKISAVLTVRKIIMLYHKLIKIIHNTLLLSRIGHRYSNRLQILIFLRLVFLKLSASDGDMYGGPCAICGPLIA
jgi:hypothetical protein